MREIKFRAWFDGHMYEVAKLDFWGDPEQATCDMAGPGKNGEWEELFDIYVSDVELMQYTGLKDKNGIKIYEGDIVLCDRNVNDAFDKITFLIGIDEYFRYQGASKLGNEISVEEFKCAEVLGNIYEQED